MCRHAAADDDNDAVNLFSHHPLCRLRRPRGIFVLENKSLGDKFVDRVSLMGLTEAVKAKQKVAKLLWILVFLCCLAAATYFVYKTFEEYADNPTATKVKMVRQKMYSYPPLVLCVDTWLNFEKAEKMGLTKEAVHYALSFMDIPFTTYRQSNSNTARNEFEQVYYKYNFTSLDDFFKYISLDAIEVDNTFRGHDPKYGDYIQVMSAYEGNLLPKVILDRNVCYKIQLYDEDERQRFQNELIIRVPDLSSGVLKRIPYWKLYVNPSLKRKIPATPFLSILRNHTHLIRTTSGRYRVIKTPNEPCVEPNDPGMGNYSEISCSLGCYGNYLNLKLQCTAFNFETYSKRRLSEYCNSYNASKWDETMANFSRLEDTKISRDLYDCSKRCLPECNFWRYDTSVDSHVSSELQTMEHKNQRNISCCKLIIVNGDVEAGGILTFTEVYTYSFETLVGNIGGTCGIWIGASILTLVQLFSFLSKLCTAQGSKRLVRKKSNMQRDDTEGDICLT